MFRYFILLPALCAVSGAGILFEDYFVMQPAKLDEAPISVNNPTNSQNDSHAFRDGCCYNPRRNR